MVTGETLAKLKAAYKKWHDTRGQSAEDWVEMMADDVKLRSVADGADGMKFSAPRDGKEAARGYFAALGDEWEMVYHHADEFLVDGDRVAVFGRCAFRHRGTGKVAESFLNHRWRFRAGLVVEYAEFYDTARAFAAATPDTK
jgi:ketosteroid isomerase-like protein